MTEHLPSLFIEKACDSGKKYNHIYNDEREGIMVTQIYYVKTEQNGKEILDAYKAKAEANTLAGKEDISLTYEISSFSGREARSYFSLYDSGLKGVYVHGGIVEKENGCSMRLDLCINPLLILLCAIFLVLAVFTRAQMWQRLIFFILTGSIICMLMYQKNKAVSRIMAMLGCLNNGKVIRMKFMDVIKEGFAMDDSPFLKGDGRF